MSLQLATIDYEIKGQEPRSMALNLMQRIHMDNHGGTLDNGRSFITVSGASSTDSENFKRVVKAYRKGDINRAETIFPVRIGQVAYITTIPTASYINILFRHDSCIASNNHTDEDDGHVYTDNHYQPQVYFMVKIKLSDGTKSWKVVQSPVSAQGRMFPHNDSSGQYVVSGCCAGDYSDQIQDSLKAPNLSAFLSLVSMYITQGTNSQDEYGRSCRNFIDNREADREVNYSIENALNAKLLAYTMSDPELPHGMVMENQKRTFHFQKPEYQDVYFQALCELSATPTAEVTE